VSHLNFKLNLILFWVLLLTIIISSDIVAQSDSVDLQKATESSNPLGLTVEQGLGKKLLFDYSIPEAGVNYRMHVILRVDEVSWTELRDEGHSETDTAQLVKLDDHRIIMSWFENSGQFVVLYVNFMKGQTTYSGLLRPGLDKKGVIYSGTISL
jgi:hypothetical protein